MSKTRTVIGKASAARGFTLNTRNENTQLHGWRRCTTAETVSTATGVLIVRVANAADIVTTAICATSLLTVVGAFGVFSVSLVTIASCAIAGATPTLRSTGIFTLEHQSLSPGRS